MSEKKPMDRRSFIKKALMFIGGGTVAGLLIGPGAKRIYAKENVWQIDPSRCTNCGRCQTACINPVSAVKCIRIYALCGYCDLCSGYFRSGVTKLTTAAENQLCPTSAIKRTYIEDPYFEYTVDEKLCIACGKCAKACEAFGNGSLYLQIKQDLCAHCHQCEIAAQCPGGAVKRVSVEKPYLLKGDIA